VSSQHYTPPEVVRQGECNNATKNGGKKAESIVYNLGGVDSFQLKYNTKTYPDNIIIFDGNGEIFRSGCVGTKGWETRQINKSAYSSQIRIDIYPNCDGKNRTTRWHLKVICPK
jgi:hypothetical protein